MGAGHGRQTHCISPFTFFLQANLALCGSRIVIYVLFLLLIRLDSCKKIEFWGLQFSSTVDKTGATTWDIENNTTTTIPEIKLLVNKDTKSLL